MIALDPLTLERVARLICDVDGPYERTGTQVERFLHRVRWPSLGLSLIVDQGLSASC